MIKWIARIVFVVVVLVILALIGAYFYGSALVSKSIAKAGTYATGQTTTVDGASLGIFSGQLSLDKLAIDNPKGFNGDHFLTLGKGTVAVSLGSLMSDTIRVPTFHLDDIAIDLEQSGGKSNYKMILDHLQSLSSAQPTKDAKKWVVDDLQITNVQVTTQIGLAGVNTPPVTVKIPKIVLKDVRSDSTAKLMGEVLKQVLGSVIDQAGGKLPKQLTAGLDGQLKSIGKLGDTAKKQLNDAAQQMLQGVGGIFNDKKKSK